MIKKHTPDSLIVYYDDPTQPFTEKYKLITRGNFTDQLIGHWDGENGSYIQIIPKKNSSNFKLIRSKEPGERAEKTGGFLDEKNSRIVFYLEKEEMALFFEAGQETISIGGNPIPGNVRASKLPEESRFAAAEILPQLFLGSPFVRKPTHLSKIS